MPIDKKNYLETIRSTCRATYFTLKIDERAKKHASASRGTAV